MNQYTTFGVHHAQRKAKRPFYRPVAVRARGMTPTSVTTCEHFRGPRTTLECKGGQFIPRLSNFFFFFLLSRQSPKIGRSYFDWPSFPPAIRWTRVPESAPRSRKRSYRVPFCQRWGGSLWPRREGRDWDGRVALVARLLLEVRVCSSVGGRCRANPTDWAPWDLPPHSTETRFTLLAWANSMKRQ